MAEAFVALGYNLISQGTDNHLMLLDLRNKGVTGKQAENSLGKADITVNKNMVPFDTQSPMITSGIRIGSAAVTSRGFREEDCRKTVEWIDAVITEPANESRLQAIRQDVNDYMSQFPLYA